MSNLSRKTFLVPVLVNGIPMVTVQTESLMDAYRRRQRECPHEKRDPKGTCYHCGHQEVK